MRNFLIILITLLFSCQPTKEEILAKKHHEREMTKYAMGLSESFCENDLEDAIVLLDSVLNGSPKDHSAFYTKLGILIQLSKPEEAMKLIDSVIKMEPNLPGNYFFKGMVYDEYRDSANAIKNFKKDIALYDKMLDTLKRESSDYKTAVFNKAVDQIYSGNQEGNRTLVDMYAIEKDRDLKELISLFMNMRREDLIHREKLRSRNFFQPYLRMNDYECDHDSIYLLPSP